jgi:hypothetical protein
VDCRRPLPTDRRRLHSASIRFCESSSPMADIKGRLFERLWPKRFRTSRSKSSNGRITPKASRFSHGVGLPNALSLLCVRYSIKLWLQTLFDRVSGSFRSIEFAPHLAVAEGGNAGNACVEDAAPMAPGVAAEVLASVRCRTGRPPYALLAEPMMVASMSVPCARWRP